MTAPIPAYVYRATLDRVVDADTYWLLLDVGLLAGAVIRFPVQRVAGYGKP